MKLMEIVSLYEATLTPAEVSKIAQKIADTPDASESESHFDNRDGAEIYLPTVGFTKTEGGMKIWGMNPGALAKQKECLIPINGKNLHYGQMSVQKGYLKKVADRLSANDPDEDLPEVVYFNGNFHVQEGHHRVTVLKLAGRDFIKVKLVVVKEEPTTSKSGREVMKPIFSKPKVDKQGRFIPPAVDK